MDIKDKYLSIAFPSEGLFKDKGSRFIAFARPVSSEEEVKAIIENIRKEYHDARHCCFAYRLGADGSKWRASDDGEPSGSAGRQILGRIDSAGLSDVLVVVVRYFGGILLGVPGLIRAYKNSSSDALSKAEVIEKTATRKFSLGFDYSLMPAVMKMLKDMDLTQSNQHFDQKCSLETEVRLSMVERFMEKASDISGLSLEDTF